MTQFVSIPNITQWSDFESSCGLNYYPNTIFSSSGIWFQSKRKGTKLTRHHPFSLKSIIDKLNQNTPIHLMDLNKNTHIEKGESILFENIFWKDSAYYEFTGFRNGDVVNYFANKDIILNENSSPVILSLPISQAERLLQLFRLNKSNGLLYTFRASSESQECLIFQKDKKRIILPFPHSQLYPNDCHPKIGKIKQTSNGLLIYMVYHWLIKDPYPSYRNIEVYFLDTTKKALSLVNIERMGNIRQYRNLCHDRKLFQEPENFDNVYEIDNLTITELFRFKEIYIYRAEKKTGSSRCFAINANFNNMKVQKEILPKIKEMFQY